MPPGLPSKTSLIGAPMPPRKLPSTTALYFCASAPVRSSGVSLASTADAFVSFDEYHFSYFEQHPVEQLLLVAIGTAIAFDFVSQQFATHEAVSTLQQSQSQASPAHTPVVQQQLPSVQHAVHSQAGSWPLFVVPSIK